MWLIAYVNCPLSLETPDDGRRSPDGEASSGGVHSFVARSSSCRVSAPTVPEVVGRAVVSAGDNADVVTARMTCCASRAGASVGGGAGGGGVAARVCVAVGIHRPRMAADVSSNENTWQPGGTTAAAATAKSCGS